MTKNTIILKAKQIKQQQKTQAETAARERAAALEQNAEYKANAANIVTVQIQIAKNLAYKKPVKTEQALLKVLETERTQILKKLKVNPADLEPKYTCKICKDTGTANGKYCKCFTEIINKELNALSGANLNPKNTFANADLKLFKDNPNMQKAYKLMDEYCKTYPHTRSLIITLVGPVGVGKTYLVEAMCNALITRGFVTSFLTSFNFNNTCLKYHTTFDENKFTYLNSLLEPDFLVIDDLGTEPMLNNITKEYLFLVLNERLLNKTPTILTSNLMPEELIERYGERVYSRISDKQNATIVNLGIGSKDRNDLRHKK